MTPASDGAPALFSVTPASMLYSRAKEPRVVDGMPCADFDGVSEWATAPGPVRADRSFSIGAWVRLDSSKMVGGSRLNPGSYAATAVAQSGPTHSPFYLGVRVFAAFQFDLSTKAILRWTFTAAPTDGGNYGDIDWQHATAALPVLTTQSLDRWVYLAGVLDVDRRTASLHVFDDEAGQGVVFLPSFWPFWTNNGDLTVGQAPYLEQPSDFWPGQVGAVTVWERPLDHDELRRFAESGQVEGADDQRS